MSTLKGNRGLIPGFIGLCVECMRDARYGQANREVAQPTATPNSGGQDPEEVVLGSNLGTVARSRSGKQLNRRMFIFLPLVLSLSIGFPSRQVYAVDADKLPKLDDHELLLSGEDWKVAAFEPGTGMQRRAFDQGFSEPDALPATVPGDVHWDLERTGKIPPIYYGQNSKEIGWVAGKEWWYRKTFTVPAHWRGKTVRLRFEGVDYQAEIWVNSVHLGEHEGQFTPFEFDVGSVLRFGVTNTIAVLIHAAPAEVRDAIATGRDEWGVMQTTRHAYPKWKSQTNAGWDWGAKIITMGIWKDVRLIAADGPYISRLTVLPQLAPPYDRAQLKIQAHVDTHDAGPAQFCCDIECLTAEKRPIRSKQTLLLQPGGQEVQFNVELRKPLLWWPNGYGPQHLYRLVLSGCDSHDRKESDRAIATFGIRDLQMLQNPESAQNLEYIDYTPTDQPVLNKLPQPPPERQYLMQINGRRIFARGGNWVPCDLLFGRPRQPVYEHLIRSASLAHLNLFRIWGGGLIEKPIFYDLCDRYGILLFQEFPNAGVRLPEDDAALAISAEETRQVLPLLMNHPCIVRYGGGNEWYRNASNSRQMAQLRRICGETDPTRPFHDPDPECIAQRHGPYAYDYVHHYEIYDTGRPMNGGPDDPLEWTEYGTSGAASVETLRAIMPQENLWPIRTTDPYWRWHKAFAAYGDDNWMGSAQYRYLFGELPDLETTVRCSQFIQAEGLRYANQAMRRRIWHRSACAFWTYDEPWPNAAHGCVIEYSGRPKMAYFYAKQSYAPVDVSAVYSNLVRETDKPLAVEIWGTNDRAQKPSDCRCRYKILDLQGRMLAEQTLKVDLPPESSQKLYDIGWTPPASMDGSVILLNLELLSRANTVLARNLYTFGIQNRPEKSSEKNAVGQTAPPMRPLVGGPQTSLRLALLPGRGAPGRAEPMGVVEVQNTGSVPALFVKLGVNSAIEMQVYWEDNYFLLLSGERRRVGFSLVEPPGTSASPRPITFQAGAWNSAPAFGGGRLAH